MNEAKALLLKYLNEFGVICTIDELNEVLDDDSEESLVLKACLLAIIETEQKKLKQ